MEINSNFFMSLALKEAWKYQGLTYPNPAVGCTLVGANFELLALAAHQKAGNPHAEVLALQSAYFKLTKNETILHLTASSDIHTFLLENHKNIFKDTVLFTTLEPCAHEGKTPSCASLIAQLGIKKVYIGSRDLNEEAANGAKRLVSCGIEVEMGILREECEALIQPFIKWRERNFVFFKWAQRLNGTIDGGIISSFASRKNVHAMRAVCDLLVIGGNTVRTDRPTLDARLVNAKAPDILILSREKDFDRTIPLFSVANRKVMISESLEGCKEYKNIMIEGSSKMFELTRDIVDYYLCYLVPTFGGRDMFTFGDEKLNILNVLQVDEDIMIWMKKDEDYEHSK